MDIPKFEENYPYTMEKLHVLDREILCYTWVQYDGEKMQHEARTSRESKQK